jgi:protein SCO1/2
VRLWVASCRGVSFVLAACAALWVQAAVAQEWHGRQPPPEVGGALDLIDHQGARFALSRVAGRPALVFFGFTHCGSTCPQALATAREVLHTLGSVDTTVLFVTLDPLSDGPEQLRSFVQRLDPRIVGLTGSPQQIEQAAERYGVSLRVQAGAIEHSSMFYLLDASSRVQRVYPHNTPAPDLMADIRRLRVPSDASPRPTALASAKRQPLAWGAAAPSP